MLEFTIFDLAKGHASPNTMQQDCQNHAISVALVPSGTIGGGALKTFFGPCSVIDLSLANDQKTIDTAEVKDALAALTKEIERIKKDFYENVETPNKVLVKTRNAGSFSPGRHLTAEALATIFEHGIELVGVDTSELDPPNRNDNLEFARRNKLACLINLELGDVDSGFLYILAAPPMFVEDCDLVPVRPLLLMK